MEKAIIFWLDGPPLCCKGVFDATARLWKGKSYYVCTKEINENRAKIASETGKSDGSAEYVMLSQMENPKESGMKFLNEHIDDIHVFNGYMSNSSVYLNELLKINKQAKAVVWAERPNVSVKNTPFNIYEKIRDFRHKIYAGKLKNKVSALLPLGQVGVEKYISLGWSSDKVFPFLYLPVMNENIMPVYRKEKPEKIKFVYLGRFAAGWKGIDVLISACEKLKNNNYTLTMVGGYGDYKEQTLEYIEQNPNLEFGGTWKIDEACDRLSEYDVCIVPSRYEGWNVTVNEALMAGTGCIVTDASVSDEMVSASETGIVVKAGDASSLAEAMDYVMSNTDLVNKWRKNAFDFRPNMTSEACAEYFIDVLRYLFYGAAEKPLPPWIK